MADVEKFREEFAYAASSVHPVCARHVGPDGLPLTHKMVAVEVTLNLLEAFIGRLPDDVRRAVIPRIADSIRRLG